MLRKRWRKLERAVDALSPWPELDDLHRIRILTKRVRYASEAVAPAFGDKAKRFTRAAAILQDQLGELNDAAVTRARLSGVSPVLTGPAAFTAGQLSQQLMIDSSVNAHAWRKAYPDRREEVRHLAWVKDGHSGSTGSMQVRGLADHESQPPAHRGIQDHRRDIGPLAFNVSSSPRGRQFILDRRQEAREALGRLEEVQVSR